MKKPASKPLATSAAPNGKYVFFALFLFLTVLWTFVFGAAKYFLWANFKDSLAITLEHVGGYLAVGGGVAYLVGGWIVKRYGVRPVLVFSAVAAGALFSGAYLVGYSGRTSLFGIVLGFGFLYGLWVVSRSVLASLEIRRTKLADTAVTGSMNVAFIVSIIVGSVAGGKIAEVFASFGHLVLAVPLALSFVVAFFFSHSDFDAHPDCSPKEFVTGFSRWKAVLSRHALLLVSVAMLWSLSTVASQQVIQASVALFSKTPSEAAAVLLYSSVGAIFGNFASAKLAKFRWKAFQVTNAVFAVCLLFIPAIFDYAQEAGTYVPVIAVALVIGVFFAVAANLAEGLYFKKIEEEDEKEFGSSLYGIVLSASLALTMAGISWVSSASGAWQPAFYVLSVAAAVVGGLAFAYSKKAR